ncbi:MAG: hypothetical protein ACREC9_13585 [Methylocella sp.]
MAHGRSYEEIEEMTLTDLRFLYDYWADHPTSDDILRSVYRIEMKPRESAVLAAEKIEFGPEFQLSPLECAKALAKKTSS